MAKFIVEPHFRLQEWVAEEKGYFRAEGLDYEFRELIRSTGGQHHNKGAQGAFHSIEKGREADVRLRLGFHAGAPRLLRVGLDGYRPIARRTESQRAQQSARSVSNRSSLVTQITERIERQTRFISVMPGQDSAMATFMVGRAGPRRRPMTAVA